MKRLFIAVDISEHARHLAATLIENLRAQFPNVKVGWERPEKLHLTIKFLGATSDELAAKVSNALRAIAQRSQPFELIISGKGVFPSPRNPRVLWLGTEDPTGDLAILASEVIDAMAEIGFEPEKRSFKAHVTIARLKEPGSARALVNKHLEIQYSPVDFAVNQIVLYESQLRPTASVYSKLAIFPLSASRSIQSRSRD